MSDTVSPIRFPFPKFSSSDAELDEVYSYRELVYNKHIRQTPEGLVVTEFLPDVGWAGKYNTISCAASHHILDGRWLNDKKVCEDYLRFWMTDGPAPRSYSFPYADSLWQFCKVTGDFGPAKELYEAAAKNYGAWEASNFRRSFGLFFQIDDRDGMEFSISGNGLRPTLSSYLYADALALSKTAALLGKEEERRGWKIKADSLRREINRVNWNREHGFYETLYENGYAANVRELVGYVPFIYGIPPKERDTAFAELWKKDGFFGKYGPTTAERRHPDFNKHFDHECLWNGPSWPYATTQVLDALITVLHRGSDFVTPEDFLRLLKIYAHSHRDDDGTLFLDENLDPDTGKWIARDILKEKGTLDRGIFYNHSAFIDPVIRGLCGVIPGEDETVTVHPLCGGLEYYSLDGVNVRGRELSVEYEKGCGLKISVDGKTAAEGKAERLEITL